MDHREAMRRLQMLRPRLEFLGGLTGDSEIEFHREWTLHSEWATSVEAHLIIRRTGLEQSVSGSIFGSRERLERGIRTQEGNWAEG